MKFIDHDDFVERDCKVAMENWTVYGRSWAFGLVCDLATASKMLSLIRY